jgi:hypothetical protein
MVRKIVGTRGKAGGHGSMAGGRVRFTNGPSAHELEAEMMWRAKELLA